MLFFYFLSFSFLTTYTKAISPKADLHSDMRWKTCVYKSHLLLLKAVRCAEKLVQYDNILNTETRFIWLVYNIKQKSNTNVTALY